MDATQQNMLALVAIVGVSVVFALVVAALSSRSLRDEGLRKLVKRWLAR